MGMELILRSETVTIPQAIENIQVLKKELAERLDYYKGVIVTEDTIRDAKADKANLNKLKTAIDDQRKEVKRQTMALYEPLERECKELLSMIDEPIGVIDRQLKAFDEQKRQEKYKALAEFFGQINTLDFVKIEHVLNPKWGNATMKLDTLKGELSAAVSHIADDYADIKNLYAGSPMLTAIMQRFETTRDKGAALAYAAEIERRERAEQERRAREAAEMPTVQPEPLAVQKSFTLPESAVTHTTEQPEPVGQAAFRVTGTRSQIRALAAFMRENGITYEVIK